MGKPNDLGLAPFDASDYLDSEEINRGIRWLKEPRDICLKSGIPERDYINLTCGWITINIPESPECRLVFTLWLI